MSITQSSLELLNNLNISNELRCRINLLNGNQTLKAKDSSKTFVLYLPTVNLRFDHNPAFALACHLSNLYNVPCIVLATVLDDQLLPIHMKQWNLNETTNRKMKPIVMTSRRLAFLLEALSEAGTHWSNHGAGVVIRVHGPQCRSPDHLTLSSRAMAVVTDEPFVHPFLNYVLQVERTCRQAGIACFRVDGSTTVPPVSVLKRCINPINDSNILYKGVPSKAWMWQKQTETKRMSHILAAMGGDFDAPTLSIQVEDDFFFLDESKTEENSPIGTISSTLFPLPWRDVNVSAPGSRPWSILEFRQIFEQGIKEWSLNWNGADTSVKPCVQTVGTCKAGWKRWDNFVRDRKGLVHYGRLRGDPKLPHASSRMSCYLNYGIVSIFRIVHEVKLAQTAKVAGADKFEEEIVKWREMSYAHAFSRTDYNDISAIPTWAVQWIEAKEKQIDARMDITNLDDGESPNEKWNAMQKYLIRTGELHNNVRMTWGKTLVEWLSSQPLEASVVIQALNYLNDRYALDGLSPPSYAGINWCLGWCDKQDINGGITTKSASRYSKLTVSEFEDAEQALLHTPKNMSGGRQSSILGSLQTCESSTITTKRKEERIPNENAKKSKHTKTLHDFFHV